MISLSIITINYNDAVGLEKTMASVINQTFKDFEYIIIDGSSTDGSVDVIKNFEEKIDYWISEPDSGIYNAMNKGIAKARGKYLLFLNSGDYLYSKTTIFDTIQFLNDDISFISGNTKMLSKEPWIKKSPEKMYHSYLYQNSLPHPSTFINHKMFEKYGCYDQSYPIIADWTFFFTAIVINAESYLHIDKTVASFDMNGVSASSSHSVAKNSFISKVHPYAEIESLDYFLISQFINPNKRVKLIAKIESNRFLSKIATLFLSILTLFKK